MPHNIILEENVDLYKFPEVCFTAHTNTQITIGDLHGNTMKLLFMLVKQGIATHISKDNYNNLVKIYRKEVDTLTTEDIAEFNLILAGITFNKTAIRLIGDELGDRGNNDYFTLQILKKLQEQQVPVEIIISNHSIEFLEACEKYTQNNHFHAPLLQHPHANSLENLHALIEKGMVSAEEILNLAQIAYKPNLKAISYSLNDNNSEITIYSHAGIGLDTVSDLAMQFQVPYQDNSAVALATTIDEINRKFQDHVQQSTVHTQCPEGAMYDGYRGRADLTKTPLVCAMWNRRYDLIQRPTTQNGYDVVYVHGHDSNDEAHDETHVHNLDSDNSLGKMDHFNIGTYIVLKTDIYPQTLVEKHREDIVDDDASPDYQKLLRAIKIDIILEIIKDNSTHRRIYEKITQKNGNVILLIEPIAEIYRLIEQMVADIITPKDAYDRIIFCSMEDGNIILGSEQLHQYMQAQVGSFAQSPQSHHSTEASAAMAYGPSSDIHATHPITQETKVSFIAQQLSLKYSFFTPPPAAAAETAPEAVWKMPFCRLGSPSNDDTP